MLEAIGNILKDARRSAGLSLVAVAHQAGLPKEVLERIEAGSPGLTTSQFDRLCSTLRLEPKALAEGKRVDLPLAPSVFLRHGSQTDLGEADGRQIDEVVEQARALNWLGDRLGVAPGPRRTGRFLPREAPGDRPEAAAQDGHDLARRVREATSLGSDPIADAALLAEETLEVAVVVRRFNSTRITAASVRWMEAAAVILNASDPDRSRNPLLARVHIAHELCHLLFDPSDGGVHLVLDDVEDRRDSRAERRARGFAAEFLLPRAGLVGLLGPPTNVVETQVATTLVATARGYFGTPWEICAHHLCNLGFVDPSIRDWVVAAPKGPLAPSQTTSLPAAGEPSRLLRNRVRQAHEAALVTDGEAKAALGLDVLSPIPWDTPA